MTHEEYENFMAEFQSSGLSYKDFLEKKFGSLDSKDVSLVPERIISLCDALCTELNNLCESSLVSSFDQYRIFSLKYDIYSNVFDALSIFRFYESNSNLTKEFTYATLFDT